MTIRSYQGLIAHHSFEERFRYLSLDGTVGVQTFGFDRWINQQFYTSREWKRTRDFVIVRDDGCDLGVDGFQIHDRVLVHHMNPLTPEDVIEGSDILLNPDFLITTSHRTHNAIHYGDESLLPQKYVPRAPGDTLLWGRKERDEPRSQRLPS